MNPDAPLGWISGSLLSQTTSQHPWRRKGVTQWAGLTTVTSLLSSIPIYYYILYFIKWYKGTYRFLCSSLIKLTLPDEASSLKTLPRKRPLIKRNTNNSSTNEQQENGTADSTPTSLVHVLSVKSHYRFQTRISNQIWLVQSHFFQLRHYNFC